MKSLLLKHAVVAAICMATALPSFAQAGNAKAAEKIVSQETMKAIYEEVKTPYKVGMVLLPEKGECSTGRDTRRILRSPQTS